MGGSGAIQWPAIKDWVLFQGGGHDEVRIIADAIRVLDIDRFERLESERRTRKSKQPERGRRR